MKRISLTLLLAVASIFSYAGTPAEDLINSATGTKGVQVIEATGFVMKFARSAIRKTPMKPLANQVTGVTVCKMEKGTPEFISKFEAELRDTLKSYKYYGIKPGEEGRLVETYSNFPVDGIITEIVIFNPELHSVFSLRGRYTIEELMSLDKNNAANK